MVRLPDLHLKLIFVKVNHKRGVLFIQVGFGFTIPQARNDVGQDMPSP
jgi:hypothetical protein